MKKKQLNNIKNLIKKIQQIEMSIFNIIFILLLSLIVTHFAHAEPIQKYIQCSTDSETGEIKGKNISQPEIIASVSKVFTTLWAAKKFGLDYRFPTGVYVQHLGQNKYDVHLKGSVFPYFDRSMLYFLFSELNKRNIHQISHLTFDENFEYGSAIRTKRKLAHQGKIQTEDDITKELKRDIYNLNANYENFVTKTKPLIESKKIKKQIGKSIDIRIDEVSPLSYHVAEGLFKKSLLNKNRKPSNQDKSFSFNLKSVELHRILKEMNRNSHNFAADKIFERLSLTDSFNEFMKSLKISSQEFEIYNGSGFPITVNNQKLYNKASCKSVITVMKELNKIALKNKLALNDLLPVANKDATEDGLSTVTKMYSTEYSKGSLIAKTGTVNNWISLGGALLTQKGLVYFHMGIAHSGVKSSMKNSQEKIKTFIKKTVNKNDGKEMLSSYKPQPFLPFDDKSI